jgi:uncharacterized repeat protein (TIGR03847 family)
MEQGQVKYALGAVSSILAETFGEPGQRTFRLVMEAGAARSLVWLEKEQLYQLGIYLQEAISTLSEEDRQRAAQAGEPPWAGGEESVEFKARQMMLSYSVPANYFYLQAYEADEGEEPGASISCWVSPEQAGQLAREALEICAAGRPPCFLCGMPISPDGHVCPRANGHAVLESG